MEKRRSLVCRPIGSGFSNGSAQFPGHFHAEGIGHDHRGNIQSRRPPGQKIEMNIEMAERSRWGVAVKKDVLRNQNKAPRKKWNGAIFMRDVVSRSKVAVESPERTKDLGEVPIPIPGHITATTHNQIPCARIALFTIEPKSSRNIGG